MQHQALEVHNLLSTRTRPSVLKNQVDDLLVAVAILGLVATISDGRAEYREIDRFTFEFRKRFALSRRHSIKLIGLALRRIRFDADSNVIHCACDTLNMHLNTEQRLGLYDALGEILIADGIVSTDEEDFLDYIAEKLELCDSLSKLYRAS